MKKKNIKRTTKKPKFKELAENERKVILNLVRAYVSKTGMARELELGLEHCEELVIGMLEDNFLKIVVNKEQEAFTIVPNMKKWGKKDVKK